MADPGKEAVAHTSGDQGRNSPSSSVCYLGEVALEGATESAKDDSARQRPDESAPLLEQKVQEDDGGSTPRSEVLVTAEQPATGTSPAAAPGNSAKLAADYFAPRPVRYPSALLNVPAEGSLETASSPSAEHAFEAKVESPSPAAAEPISLGRAQISRPPVQRDLSSISTSSTASTSTIRASDFLPQLTAPRPQFPNQAYSALSAQHHPQPYAPRYLRTRSSNPSPYLSYTAQAEFTTVGRPSDPRVTAESGSRTAGNSPANSPSLFTPTSSPSRADFANPESQPGYPSPYLHFTHRQMPKETHLAEIDRDPISGRKMINQYEVIDELGRGVHGKVKLGRNLDTNEFVAIKIVERYSKRPRLGKSGNHEEKIKREIAILKKARHPNIVGLLEVIDDPDVKKVYIILEHVAMGEIRWRTEGAREICLVEWRRYNREIHGRANDEAAELEDDRILQEARRNREKADRHRWRRFRREHKAGGPATDVWSLEHGDELEDDFNDNMSRASTLTDEGNRSQPATDISHPPSHEHADPVLETTIHDDQRHERLHLLGHESSGPSPQLSERDPDDRLDLEGTMYGAYSFDAPRDETPSDLGSSDSLRHLDEDKEDIPEHFRYVPLMTMSATRAAFRDTVLGLEFLHYQGVVHRDIKPANLLQAADHHIKISDFGVSYLGRETAKAPEMEGDASESEAPDPDDALELAKTVGTPAFYAPELCQTDPDEDAPPVTNQIDLWALGVTLYCLVFGRVPFHDNNTFVLMKRIAEEKAHIPRHRLKAVEEHASSRPSSHGRNYKLMNSNKRLPHDFEVEPVDDELYDLLSRLLEKDPRKRIKLIEVKRHPWVLKDLGIDPVKWLDETDTMRQQQGQKIEISKEDVDVAVVPAYTIMGRLRDTVRKVGDLVGINRSSSKVKRDRGRSNAGQRDNNQPSSAASSSSTISQDARRQQEARRPSLKPEDSIMAALRASKEPEHPLSQSLTASPEARERLQYFADSAQRPPSREALPDSTERAGEGSLNRRPGAPSRGMRSSRTIRQVDIPEFASTGASTLPAYPSTPMVMDTISNTSLGNILDHTIHQTKRVMRNFRSRERKGNRERDTSLESASMEDVYADPSIGISNAVAAGQVQTPLLPKEGSAAGSSGLSSPISSRPPSLASDSHDRLQNAVSRSDDSGLSRQSSLASVSSPQRPTGESHPPVSKYLPLTAEVVDSKYSRPNPVTSSTAETRFLKAQDELVRRRWLEEEQKHDRPSSSLSQQRPPSSLSQGACPPSPDDELFVQKQQHDAQQKLHPAISPMEALPETEPAIFNAEQLEKHNIISSSSEDQFPSAISQSTSNPSIPSAVSVGSSLPPDDAIYMLSPDKVPAEPHTERSESEQHDQDDQEGYDGDGDAAVDSDSDDSFIEMSRHRSRAPLPKRSEGVSNGELALHHERKAPGSTRSTRSGSSNTMKVRSQGDSPEDAQRGRQ